MSSMVWPSCLTRACNPATRSAEGPMSTPRRLCPRSMGTPMMRTFCGISGIQIRWRPGPCDRTGACPDAPAQRPATPNCRGGLRIHPVNHAGEGDDLADVLGAADPGHGPLEPKAKARVRHAAETAEVQVPLEGLFRQVVFLQPLNKQIVVMDALAAPDDLPVAFGRDHVDGLRLRRILGVGL